MDFFEVLKRRRSIRRFERKSVEEELIRKMLLYTFFAPSSMGRRPWHFVVVRDREVLTALSRAKRGGGARGLESAAAGIVVVAKERESGVWIEDLSVVSTYLLLVAEALGLGAFWIQIRGRVREDGEPSEDYVRRLLGIPEGYRVLSIIAIGHPGERKEPHTDEEYMPERVHRERW